MFRVTCRGQPLIGCVPSPDAEGSSEGNAALQPIVSKLVRGRPILTCEEELREGGAWAGVVEGVDGAADTGLPGPGRGWAQRSSSNTR